MMTMHKHGEAVKYVGFILIFISGLNASAILKPQESCLFLDSDVCEDRRIQIFSDFYTCETEIKFNSFPKRISYEDGKTFVSTGSETYILDNDGTLNAIKKIISPWKELYDHKNNKYYSGDGTTYVMEYGSEKEIEIVTSGKSSFNQIAMDTKGQKLFILNFHPSGGFDLPHGQLYAIKTDTLDVNPDNIILAKRIEGIKSSISAIAVEGSSQRLLLGIRKNDGSGKLIILRQQINDPCKNPISNTNSTIVTILQDTEEKLLKNLLLDSSSSVIQSTNDKELKKLQNEISRLYEKLELANNQHDKFMNYLISLANKIGAVKEKESKLPKYINATYEILKLTQNSEHIMEGSGSGSGSSKLPIEGSGNNEYNDDEDIIHVKCFSHVANIMNITEEMETHVTSIVDDLNILSMDASNLVHEMNTNGTNIDSIWIDEFESGANVF